MCLVLIAFGADLSVKDCFGKSPTMLATFFKSNLVSQLLKSVSSDTANEDNKTETCMQLLIDYIRKQDHPKMRHYRLFQWNCFCLGRHERVGADSQVSVLVDDVMQSIFMSLKKHD
eukprot:c6377_g1_i4.p1 GENE.c6377_g1_i4~~c6377_g1_i4.p1  ORF type:complete len:116 (-),score=18.81 c6377_g1_i4:5-352(-)